MDAHAVDACGGENEDLNAPPHAGGAGHRVTTVVRRAPLRDGELRDHAEDGAEAASFDQVLPIIRGPSDI